MGLRAHQTCNLIDPLAAEDLGGSFIPDCSHIWRTTGPGTPNSAEYDRELNPKFPPRELRDLAQHGDRSIESTGGIYPAIIAIQEQELREMQHQVDFIHAHRDLCPAQYPALMQIPDQGVQANYTSGVRDIPRVRGLPYDTDKPDESLLIAGKFRKDIRARRIFVCSTAKVTDAAPVEAAPSTTLEKKNPDRTVSLDRRIIAGMRRVNLGFPESQYYPARVPSLESLARLLVSMTVALPGLTIEMAKRDIASAFRLLRLHPSLSFLMCA